MWAAGEDGMMLDRAQRGFWASNGYLWLQGLLAPAAIEELTRWTRQVGEWPDTPGKWMRYYERGPEGTKVLARVENYLPFHEQLDALLCRGRIGAVLEELLGEPALVFKDKINMKAAGGAGFAPHQDAPAYVDFGVPYHVTVMAPVDAFTRDNGCLEMAREASQTTFLPQNPDGTLRADQVARFTWDPVLAVPGDLIVFDSYVPHLSGPNRSGGPRRAHYVTYNRRSDGDRRAAYYERKRALFPQECERQPGVDYARIGAQFNLANPFE
jgi:hypothetical protein